VETSVTVFFGGLTLAATNLRSGNPCILRTSFDAEGWMLGENPLEISDVSERQIGDVSIGFRDPQGKPWENKKTH